MEPYQFNVPTRAWFGRDIWKEALQRQNMLRGKVMIVTTGGSLERLGYLDEIKKQIEACTLVKEVLLYDGISANPRLSEVRKGILRGSKEGAEVIVGFGGGSAMDAAKAIAAGLGSDEDIGELFYREKEPGERTLPLLAMPTTAGTGSEMSRAAILTDETGKIKKGIRGNALYPSMAIVDSLFTESVPERVTAETGFDVLAHAMESYLSAAASPYTRMQSEYAIQIVGEYLPRLSLCPKDPEAREKMSFASMIMGINLGNAGTCLPHRLQYPLGAHTDTSHGSGLAALYPAWLRCEYRYVPEMVERMLCLLNGEPVYGEEGCARAFWEFLEKIMLTPSLQGLGIRKEQLKQLASEVTGNIGNDPAAREDGIILKLYNNAWQEAE